MVTGKFLFFSPNLVWLVIALLDYFLFPYDYQAARKFENFNWVIYRYSFNMLQKLKYNPQYVYSLQVSCEFRHYLWFLWVLALRPLWSRMV